MPYIVSQQFKEDLLARRVNFQTDIIYAALMTEKHEYSMFNYDWHEVKHNEVKGKGYVSGGQPLLGMKLYRRNGKIIFTSEEPSLSWHDAKFTMKSVALYFPTSDKLIGTVGFDHNKRVNATLTVEWHREGIMNEPCPDEPPQYLTYYLEQQEGSNGR